MTRKPLVFLALLMPALAIAQGTVQWGSTDKPYRQPMDGMKGYYEPEKLVRNGDVLSFTVYRSADPVVPDVVGKYMVNCETREYATVEGAKPSSPMKLLPGEQLYAVSAKFCEWPDGKGYFKQFF